MKMKLIRVERGYTQEEMAEVLGISKKTLVQIEKGRVLAGWTTAAALCALFRDSEVIQGLLGEEPLEIMETVAHQQIRRPRQKTLGGKVWWRPIAESGPFRLQQNVISMHYRIIDAENYRWFSSMDREEAMRYLTELSASTASSAHKKGE
nr:helix-turn-helix domain-containing protein [Brevibacillus sp. SYP-B805]